MYFAKSAWIVEKCVEWEPVRCLQLTYMRAFDSLLQGYFASEAASGISQLIKQNEHLLFHV